MIVILSLFIISLFVWFFFFFNDTATTEIYTLSLHDALPISLRSRSFRGGTRRSFRHTSSPARSTRSSRWCSRDRKSTRLNSSHSQISYAVFCLKKKKKRYYVLYLSIRSTRCVVCCLDKVNSS